MDSIRPGLEGTASVRVSRANSTIAFGVDSVSVFATPFMVALAEEAARNAVESLAPPGRATVGAQIDIKHIAPSPLGFEVTARARLVETSGSKLVFDFKITDDVGMVGEGRHIRFMVSGADFEETIHRRTIEAKNRE